MQLFLVRLECSSIQSYIFASNRLREAIGGSYLIKQTTSTYLKYFLRQAVKSEVKEEWEKAIRLEILHDTTVGAEILYSGGGNAVIIFKDSTELKAFLNRMSGQLLAIAPGITLLSGVAAFESELIGELNRACKEAQERLERLKEAAWVGTRLEGISVNRSCEATGLAAAIRYKDKSKENNAPAITKYYSAGTVARLEAAREAQDINADPELEQILSAAKKDWLIPFDLDDIGGKEGEKHLAVVHVDGNGLGKRLQEILNDPLQQETEVLAARIRSFSKSVNKAAVDSFKELVNELVSHLDSLEKRGLSLTKKYILIGSELEVVQGKQRVEIKKYLPLRPLVYGGDDLTFVCEGKLGLALAARYLEIFSEQMEVDENGKPVGKKFSACAGVVIAKIHFPLARAYRLSEALCASAKKAAKEAENTRNPGTNSSWLDFHSIHSGLTGSLSQMRKEVKGALGLKKPYWVTTSESAEQQKERSWEQFLKYQRNFTDPEKPWPRRIVKGLLDTLALGDNEIEKYLEQAKLRGNKLDLVDGTTFESLYAPLEAMDFCLELTDPHLAKE